MCKLQDGSDDDREIKSRDDNEDTPRRQSGHGSIGRQVVFTLIAQATISPVSKCENCAGAVNEHCTGLVAIASVQMMNSSIKSYVILRPATLNVSAIVTET